MSFLENLPAAGALVAFFQVLMIDLALAGDNAVAVGMAAAGLPQHQRRRAIIFGLAGAVVMLIGFALIARSLLVNVQGLILGGGFLLLWVCWKMYRELRAQGREEAAEGEAALEDATGVEIGAAPKNPAPAKTMRQALTQILVADLAMSLDNVLAVASAAREHPQVLVIGLMISITLMGVAATYIAKLLHRYPWIAYIGLVIIFYVSLTMLWEGHRDLTIDLGKTAQYNALAPAMLDITPEQITERLSQRK